MNISDKGIIHTRHRVAFGTAAMLVCFILSSQIVLAAPTLPEFDADNFSTPTVIDNQWSAFPVGIELEYEGETEDGTEVTKISINGDTKKVMGITTLVYRDRVYVDGELAEDTRDYLAQDDDGNIWYFGEDVDNYEDGKLSDHEGSWLAGQDGAQPGYWLPGDPQIGYEYRQEYYAGQAEDAAEVLSLTATVTAEGKTYTGCLKTADTNLLEPDSLEHKYYCKQVHALVLEENPMSNERSELVEIRYGDNDSDTKLKEKMQLLIDLLNQLIALLRR